MSSPGIKPWSSQVLSAIALFITALYPPGHGPGSDTIELNDMEGQICPDSRWHSDAYMIQNILCYVDSQANIGSVKLANTEN